MNMKIFNPDTMKKVLLLTTALLLIKASFAQVADNDSDAVYRKLVREYTLESDGSTSFREYKALHLLTHLSFNRLYGETFIIYNPEFQQLTINEAYTIMADGTRFDTPENAFNEVLPRNAAKSANYNHMREMVVTHTALEVGATIYLDYTLTSSKEFVPALMGSEIIQESSPVEQMEVIVNVPPDVELNHRMIGLRTGPEVMVMGRKKSYTWRFGGIEASPKESFRGSDLPAVPRLLFSTLDNFDAFTGWFNGQPAFALEMNEELKQVVDSIRQNESDELKVLLAIRNKVANILVDERADASWSGFRFRTPLEVWKSNGGIKMEKALLLAAMLQYADFNATPALVAPRRLFDPAAPNFNLIEDVVLIVNTKGQGTLYITPVGTQLQSLECQFANKTLIPLSRTQPAALLEPAGIRNEISATVTFIISDSLTLTGLMAFELYGAANPFLALHQNKSAIKSNISGGLLKDENSIQISNSNTAKTTLNFKVQHDQPFDTLQEYYKMMLPSLNNGFDRWRISYLLAERSDPFVMPFPFTEKYVYTVELPQGFGLVNQRSNERHRSSAGSVSISVRQRGNSVEITHELIINDATVLPGDYADFRKMINQWLDPHRRLLVIKKS